MIATARCLVLAGVLASRHWFVVVVAADVGSEVADSGLAGRAALVGPEVGDGVVKVDAAAHRGGIVKHIGGVAELELFAKPGGDFVAVDRDVSGGQIDHRFQADAARAAEQHV